MRAGSVTPGVIVDVKKIAEMMTIDESAGGFRIGAAVSGAVVGEHPRLRKVWPGVVEANWPDPLGVRTPGVVGGE